LADVALTYTTAMCSGSLLVPRARSMRAASCSSDFMEDARHRTSDASSRSGSDCAVVASARWEGSLLTRHIITVRCVGARLRLSEETHRVRLSDRRTMISALRRAGFGVTIGRSIGRVPVIRGNAVALASIE